MSPVICFNKYSLQIIRMLLVNVAWEPLALNEYSLQMVYFSWVYVAGKWFALNEFTELYTPKQIMSLGKLLMAFTINVYKQ